MFSRPQRSNKPAKTPPVATKKVLPSTPPITSTPLNHAEQMLQVQQQRGNQFVLRFLDGNNGWKENGEEPKGIPGQRRKDKQFYLTPDGTNTWIKWDGKPVDPAIVTKWPKGTASLLTEKNEEKPEDTASEVESETPSSVTAKGSGTEYNSIEEYVKAEHPYNEKELMDSSVAHIMSFLKPSDQGKLATMPGFEAYADEVIKKLSAVELMGLRQLTKANKQMADELIWGLMTEVSGMSSFQGLMENQIKAAIQVGTDRIKMAADQVDLQEVERLLANDRYLERLIWINYGQSRTGNYRDQTNQDVIKPSNVDEAQGPTNDNTSKMHNKYIVQGNDTRNNKEGGQESVITGSSNMTYSGQNLNTESMIYLKNPIVAAYFSHYFNMISNRTTGNSKEGKQFAKQVGQFNAEDNKIRIAMEPFMSINDFVKTELKGADEVVVRMYVLSVFGNKNAIDALCQMAEAGVKVSVVVDSEQYKQDYVEEAVKALQKAGAIVNLQQSPQGKIMHDKMILAHYPKTKDTEERHSVMVGSSGFTKNVYKGMNYENMVAVDDKALYDYFMNNHHLVSLKQNINFNPY